WIRGRSCNVGRRGFGKGPREAIRTLSGGRGDAGNRRVRIRFPHAGGSASQYGACDSGDLTQCSRGSQARSGGGSARVYREGGIRSELFAAHGKGVDRIKMTKTRVLVVDDSLTARKHLIEVLGADPDLEVAGEAEDGKRAIELCRSLRPDVMTLDMMLPIMSGVAVTEYVMAYCPTPILVVSSSLNRGELYKTYDALAAGAVDVFAKPSGQEPGRARERGLLASVKTASKIPVITHIRGKFGGGSGMSGARGCQACGELAQKSIVAIGASTGGPAAVAEILRALPVNFPMPVLLVIHIGDPFSAAFA